MENKKRFLVVDDDQGILNLISIILNMGNIEVDQTTDPDCSIDMVIKNNYEAVLIDLVLNSYMSGMELAMQIRRVNPSIPIYIITNYEKDDVLSKSIEKGLKINGIIEKQYLTEELKAFKHG